MNFMIHVKYELWKYEKKEFDYFSSQVVQQLMDEYRAATTKDYINFGNLQAEQVH